MKRKTYTLAQTENTDPRILDFLNLQTNKSLALEKAVLIAIEKVGYTDISKEKEQDKKTYLQLESELESLKADLRNLKDILEQRFFQ